jgi:hypothetical protein
MKAGVGFPTAHFLRAPGKYNQSQSKQGNYNSSGIAFPATKATTLVARRSIKGEE